jgi:hypothetical protein
MAGRRWREAPDEGGVAAQPGLSGLSRARPLIRLGLRPIHLLPQGEKGRGAARNDAKGKNRAKKKPPDQNPAAFSFEG